MYTSYELFYNLENYDKTNGEDKTITDIKQKYQLGEYFKELNINDYNDNNGLINSNYFIDDI